MKHKLIKLVSIIIITAMAWQNTAWAHPCGFFSLRALALAERRSAETGASEKISELTAEAQKRFDKILLYAAAAAGALLAIPSRDFRFGPPWVYILIAAGLFALAEFNYLKYKKITRNIEHLREIDARIGAERVTAEVLNSSI